MKKIFIIILFIFCRIGRAEEINKFPKWIEEIRLNAARIMLTEVNVSETDKPGRVIEEKHFTFSLKGEGSLEKVNDPFDAIEKMFSSEGWKYVPEYQADGHGSSSFAYEKGKYFCNIFIQVDSACDDEENGHVPSKFSFEIYCRENK